MVVLDLVFASAYTFLTATIWVDRFSFGRSMLVAAVEENELVDLVVGWLAWCTRLALGRVSIVGCDVLFGAYVMSSLCMTGHAVGGLRIYNSLLCLCDPGNSLVYL